MLKHCNPAGPARVVGPGPQTLSIPPEHWQLGCVMARSRLAATLNGLRFLTHALTPFPPGPARHHTEQTRGAEAGPGYREMKKRNSLGKAWRDGAADALQPVSISSRDPCSAQGALIDRTRAQARAAEAAQVVADPAPLKLDSDDQTEKSTEISVMPKDPPSTKYGSTRASDEIALHDDLAAYTEFAIARALLRHSVGFILPPHYKPDVVGEMRVIGVDKIFLTKNKAVLSVKREA